MFFIRALEKILSDPEIRRAQHAQFKLACEVVLQEIKAVQLKSGNAADRKKYEDDSDHEDHSGIHLSAENSSVSPLIASDENHQGDWTTSINSEKYFTPLELACQCDISRIVATALDCLQKLLAYGQLTGNYPDSMFPNRKLIDRIVETICRCFTGVETEDTVQLQIIKALLTVVTSQHVEIHEGTLLLALRTCYNIHLSTKSKVNQTTARAMLTQMLNVIFTRMESKLSKAIDCENNNMISQDERIVMESQGKIIEYQKRPAENGHADISGEKKISGEIDEAVGTDENSKKLSQEGKEMANEENSKPVENNRKISLIKEQVEITLPENSPQFIHILQKDAFLVFWALCKLSVKVVPDDAPQEPIIRSTESRSKMLALQLLKTIMENSGKAFKTNSIFITAIKQYLCDSLTINGTSTVPEIFQIIVSIYKILIFDFRKYLKSELEALFENMIFPVVLMTDIPPEHKRIAQQLLNSLCEDVSCLEYIFVNYDCDNSASNIFERLVSHLGSLSQGQEFPIGNKAEEDKIMMESLESIIRVLKSMKTWTDLDQSTTDQKDKMLQRSDSKVPELTIKILEKTDFKEKNFVSCLLSLIETFRFPSDGALLDNILLQLALRYCECNPSNKEIECADVAYALSYTILELADGYFSSKNSGYKMTKDQFLRSNRCISNYLPLSEEFLLRVYNLVLEHFSSSRRSSREHESLNLSKRCSLSGRQSVVAKKMFKIVSMPFLTALSTGLKESGFTKISDLCFEGMKLGIRIACCLQLKYERDAYVQMLARFTQVAIKEVKAGRLNIKITTKKSTTNTTTANGVTTAVVITTTEMKSKSIDAIQTILIIAETEGNHLGTAWLDILKCVSQIETTRLLEIPVEYKGEAGERSKSPTTSRWTSWAGAIVGTMETFLDPMRDEMSHMDPSVKKSISTSLDKIFTNSTKLTGDGVVDFIKALCHVSLNELATETPKMFSLHKIVNVANANMDRIALQLAKMWKVLGDYLVHLSCSSDEDVSTIAIDSLFEMTSILLTRDDAANFRFQEFFLWPFEEILKNTLSQSKQTLIVRCVFKLVETHSSKLNSGWKAIFNIFQYLLSCSDNNVIAEAFQAVEKVVEMYERDLSSIINSVKDTVHCLAEFACKTDSEDISVTAVKLIGRCSKLLVMSLEKSKWLLQNNIIWIKGWYPIFTEIAAIKSYCMASGTKLDLRTRALTEMFRIIKTDGVAFQPCWWPELFKVIFEIFDSLKLSEQEKIAPPKNPSEKDFNCYYCYYYVQFAIVDIITQYFKILGPTEMENFLRNIEWSLFQDDKQLARSGIYCFQELIAHNGSKFTKSNWTCVCKFMKSVVEIAQRDLRSTELSAIKQEIGFKELDTRRIVLSELIKMLNKVILGSESQTSQTENKVSETTQQLYSDMSIENLYCVLDCLEDIFRFSGKYCVLIDQKLKEAHSNELTTLKNDLIVEEALSTETQLRFLFRMYYDDCRKNSVIEVEDRLVEACITAINSFANNQSYAHRSDWTEVICYCLTNLLELPHEKFKVHATQYYPYLCEIVSLDLDVKLGSVLRECFVRIGNLFGVFEYMTQEPKIESI